VADERLAAPATEEWPLAGWLAERHSLAGRITERLLWQPAALTSGRAGLAMLRPSLRAFVPAMPIARLFQPVAGALQRREAAWSEIERFWWRRQAPELALLGGHQRRHRQIIPVPVQRDASATDLTAMPDVAELESAAEPGAATGTEPPEEARDLTTSSATAGALSMEQATAAPQPGPLAAIGRALLTVMRRLVPAMEHAPAAGSRRARPHEPAARDEAALELQAAAPDAGGADRAVPVAETGPALAQTPPRDAEAGPAPAAELARRVASAGIEDAGTALPVLPGQEMGGSAAAGPAVPGSLETPPGKQQPAATHPAAGASGEPGGAIARRTDTPGAVLVQASTDLAGGAPGPHPADQSAASGGIATLRLRALELWHRVLPRHARPTGLFRSAVGPAEEPAGAGTPGQRVSSPAAAVSQAVEPAPPPAASQTPPEAGEPSATTLIYGPPADRQAAPEAQPGSIAQPSEPDAAMSTTQAAGTSSTLAPAAGGEEEALAQTSGAAVAPLMAPGELARAEPVSAVELWRPGAPRPAPADLVAPLAGAVLQRRGIEPASERPPAEAPSAPVERVRPAAPTSTSAQPSGISGPSEVLRGVAPDTSAQGLPSWAASLSEQLRRLQRSTQEGMPRSSTETPGPSLEQVPSRTGPAGSPVQRAGSLQASSPATAGVASGSKVAEPPSIQPPTTPAAPPALDRRATMPAVAPAAGSGASPSGAGEPPLAASEAVQRPTAAQARARPEAVRSGAEQPSTSGEAAPGELVAAPSLAERLHARAQGFIGRIVQRSLELPLTHATAWAQEHTAEVAGLAGEVASQVSIPTEAVGTAGPETIWTEPGVSGRASETGMAAPPPAGQLGAAPDAGAGQVSPYAAYLEALRAGGAVPGTRHARRSSAEQGRSGAPAPPFRMSGRSSTPGVQRNMEGEAGPEAPQAALPGSSDRDQGGLAQVIMSLPPAMAAAALAKGVLTPQQGGRTETPASVEPAPPWQPLPRVQAPILTTGARAPAFEAVGADGAGPLQRAPAWEPIERNLGATGETFVELPYVVQRVEMPVSNGTLGEVVEQHAPLGQAQADELDRLADEVFELLRWRLAAERERLIL